MSDLIPSEKGGLIGLLHGAGGAIDFPQPFERDIFLFETGVAGTKHVENTLEIEPTLQIDDRLNFFREPDNPYDKSAIAVCTESGQKLGYIPRMDNIVCSRLMDAGKLLFGKLTYKKVAEGWLFLEMKIYMHE